MSEIRKRLIACAFVLSASCHAASVQAVAWSGMPTPTGSASGRFSAFSNAAVNDAATVAFDATVKTVFTGYQVIPLSSRKTSGIRPPKNPSTTNPESLPRFTNSWTGIWTITSGGAGSLVARDISYYPMIADIGGFTDLGPPLLNSSNLCAFTGNYSPGYIAYQPVLPGDPVTNFHSVYGGQGVWISTNPYSPVAFVGQSAPGYTIPFTTSVGTLDGTAGATNGTPIGTSPVTFSNRPAFTSIDRIALPDTGRLVFSATVMATNYYYPTLPTNPGSVIPLYVAIQPLVQHGLWGQDSDGNLTGILREGDSLTIGGSNRTVTSLLPGSPTTVSGSPLLPLESVNPANGDLAVNAAFDDGTQGILVASAGSNSPSLAAVTGDSAPGGSAGDFFLSFGTPSINTAGHVAFCGTAGFVTPFPIVYGAPFSPVPSPSPPTTNLPAPPQPSFTNTWSGLWAEDASASVRLIARIAPPVPDLGGFTSLGSPLLNSRHEVAFRGTYRQGFILTPPGGFAGGEGVWTSRNLATPAMWVGQTAPGYPSNFPISVKSPYGWSTNSITFRSTAPVITSIDRIAFPDTGSLVVWATASATNWVPRPPVPRGRLVPREIRSSVLNQRGIWIQNSKGTMDLALREGMSIPVNGVNKTIARLPCPCGQVPAGGLENDCSRSSGIVVTTATFTDGTQSVLVITP